MSTINIREVDPQVAARFRMAAGGRDMTAPEYLTALLRLHDAMRARADAGDDALQTELATLGLQTVIQ